MTERKFKGDVNNTAPTCEFDKDELADFIDAVDNCDAELECALIDAVAVLDANPEMQEVTVVITVKQA